MSNDVQSWWTVGEVARTARVTVRTLHHYDRLGLVTPSGRSAGGHRRYDQNDLARLLRVLSLRDLGFALEELPALLEEHDGDRANGSGGAVSARGGSSPALLATARAHRARVEEQLEKHQRLRERLDDLIAGLEHGEEPHAHKLFTVMEALAMTVNLTRIYTRRGDDGSTDLVGTTRIVKTDPRVEAIGAVDELNAAIRVALTTPALPTRFITWLQRVQNDLFDIGATLADTTTPTGITDTDAGENQAEDPEASPTSGGLGQDDINWVEQLCDRVNADLPALPSFVLPGGTPAAAHLHLARTICRRAERRVLAVPDVDRWTTRYLNRLSDLLFILSRACTDPGRELLWQPRQHHQSDRPPSSSC